MVNEDYPPNVKDLTALLTKVKNAKPDAVLAYTYPADAVLYMKGAREVGLDQKVQVVLLGPQYDFFGKIFGAARNGILTMGPLDAGAAGLAVGEDLRRCLQGALEDRS